MGKLRFAPLIVRNLLILILLVAGIWWVQRALARAKERAATGRAGQKQGDKTTDAPEHMLECAHCGVNVPESDGVRDGVRFYCCAAHRLAGPRAD